ncbi:MAG: hypothetical protein ACRCXZ_04020, partial [Patescibacteria group bacterium]
SLTLGLDYYLDNDNAQLVTSILNLSKGDKDYINQEPVGMGEIDPMSHNGPLDAYLFFMSTWVGGYKANQSFQLHPHGDYAMSYQQLVSHFVNVGYEVRISAL